MKSLRITIPIVFTLIGGCIASHQPASPPAVVQEQTPAGLLLHYRNLCANADVVTLIRFYSASPGDEHKVRMLAETDAAEGGYLVAVRDHWGAVAADREAVAFQLEGQTDDRTGVEYVQGNTATISFQRADIPRRRLIKKDGDWKLAVDDGLFSSGAFALVYYLSRTGPFDDAADGIRSRKIRTLQVAHDAVASEQKRVFDTYNGS